MNKRTDNYWVISATLQSLKEKGSIKEDHNSKGDIAG
jgi:hypothetical protein